MEKTNILDFFKQRLIEKTLDISFIFCYFVPKTYSRFTFNNYSFMKKTIMTLLAATTLMLSSCLTTGMGTAPTASQNNNVLGNVLGAVLGQVLLGGMTYGQSGILGSWNYNAPSAAFTTSQALTKAGGSATIANMTSSLASNYNNIGINRNNTSFSFLEGNKFSAKVNGIPFSGTYAYNPQNGEIALKTATETIKGNVTKTEKGMGLMFDAKQMTNILQKEGKVSNAAAVQAVSKLAKSADGARVGFELTK
jgi:hypothetical protein